MKYSKDHSHGVLGVLLDMLLRLKKQSNVIGPIVLLAFL
jgi:hypothetical protein